MRTLDILYRQLYKDACTFLMLIVVVLEVSSTYVLIEGSYFDIGLQLL